MTNKAKSKPREVTQKDVVISRQLKQVIITQNVNRRELADFLNISNSQLSKYISAIDRIPASRLFQISEFLHCDLHYLYGLQNPINVELKIINSKLDKLLSENHDDG